MNIISVIVLFNPDKSVLFANLNLLSTYSSKIFLVDNTPTPCSNPGEFSPFSNVTYKAFSENKGIAFAQNYAMSLIQPSTKDHILLLDQDSSVTTSLLNAYIDLSVYFNSISLDEYVIGPTSYDERTGNLHKRVKSIPFKADNYTLISSPTIQSSGSFFPAKILRYSPLFKSELFIDYVDWTFCFYLSSVGVPIYQILDVCMGHTLGTGTFILPILKNPIFNISTPFRYFYQVRNIFILFKYSFISKKFIFRLFIFQLLRVTLTLIFCKNKTRTLNYAFQGLITGFHSLIQNKK